MEEEDDITTTLESEEQRAKWTQAAREAYHKEHPENFAGPGDSYPIKDASDVGDAWGLAGHAANPDAVRAKIKSIAKRLGLSDALPDTAKEEDGGGKRAMEPEVTTTRGTMPDSVQLYAPITRIDREKREVILTATAERKDAYQTVIGFDGSSDAFSRWKGNVREMHDSHKAVGRAITIEPDGRRKEIDVTLRISRGAEDTWQKVLDGTLTGASIGAMNGKWTKRTIDGEEVPFLERYDLVELSLVDNPACPGCDIKIVRNDGIATEILEAENEPVQASVQPEETRAGAKISHVTQDALHGMRNNHLKNAQSTMKLCGCDECGVGCSALDPDDDGDIDILPSTDMDNDGGKSNMMAGSMRELEPMIMRALAPTIQRFNASLAQLAIHNQPIQHPTPPTIDTSAIERRLGEIETRYAELTEVRSLLSEVKEIVERVEKQPMPGGPITNGAAMDKILATRAHQSTVLSDTDVIERAAQLGLLKSQESQIAGATVQIAQMLGQR